MFSPIFFTKYFHIFFSIWAVEKEKKLVIGPKLKHVFFVSLLFEKKIMTNIR